MEKLQSQNDLSRVISSSGFVKFSGSLNLKHQVTTIDVFHDKE